MSELARMLKRGTDADRQALDTLVASVLHLATTTTEAMELYAGRAVNGVLDVQTQAFSSSGVLGNSYPTPCGSVLLVNASADDVTVIAGLGQQAGPPPATGQGITIVPAQSFLPIAIASNGWTAYGTAGDKISWTAFTGLHAFGIVR